MSKDLKWVGNDLELGTQESLISITRGNGSVGEVAFIPKPAAPTLQENQQTDQFPSRYANYHETPQKIS